MGQRSMGQRSMGQCSMGQWHQQRAAPVAVVSDAKDALLPLALTGQVSMVPSPQLRYGRFPAEPAEAARARHFVRRALAGCATAADAALLTSELFANAIQHSRSGGGSVHMLVWHRCIESARVIVIDDGSVSAPAVRRAGRLRTTGRGLLLVQELATRWGHDGGDFGRAVWFELACSSAG
jgi:anti-sigma regulatory factor (Ser/Thr protein kinase)